MKASDEKARKKILIVEDQFVEAYDLQLMLERAGYEISGIAHSVRQASEMIQRNKPDLVCLDIFLQGKETGIELASELQEKNIGFIYISANSGKAILDQAKKTQPYGFIVKPFREQDVLITLEIACYRHRHSKESLMHQVSLLQKGIDALSLSALNWEQALLRLGKILQTYIPFDYMDSFSGQPASTDERLGLFRKNFDDYQIIGREQLCKISGRTMAELDQVAAESPPTEAAQVFEGKSFEKISRETASVRLIAETFGIRTFINIVVPTERGHLNFSFYARQTHAYNSEHLAILDALENTLSRLVNNIRQFQAPKTIENIAPAIETESKPAIFEGMIGNSKRMFAVFDYIKKVAPSDTSVLILGESGTGKEKVAQSIHNLSTRKDKPLIIINCGAIPDKLAESLLFGHEKGAFTGATDRQVGKFELADGGTIFLDEVGEMPIDLQVKLLRVLQEKEIERVGGRSPIKVDVRIIAATNKNLEEEVASGKFRMDLYYRLHVFPITVPSLRERADDIPALAQHFLDLYGKMNGRQLKLAEGCLAQIVNYHWPGNIRQLEHLIHRSILLADSQTIREIQIPKTLEPKLAEPEFEIKSIHDNERDYIYYILKKCKGKVYGQGGAAELLDIPPSTLNSKIKKLGIKLKMF